MAAAATAIINAHIYCIDEVFSHYANGSIVFENGIITAVGNASEVAIPASANIVDGRGKLAVLPGLIDTHSHSSLLKGYTENAQLMQWLPEYQREHQVLNEEDAYYACLVSYMEALKGGTTTVMDMYRFLHRADAAAAALGLRVHLVPYAADNPAKAFFETLETSEQLIRDKHNSRNGLTKVWLGLEHITYCSEAMFRRVRELSDQYGVSIHSHSSEQAEEVEAVKRLFGQRPIHKFNEWGILKPGSVIAHAVWLDDSEIKVLADTGTGVAHCPISNMKLAGGVAPLGAFAQAGITVGLGSDGAICNNSLSLWECMKTGSLLQKVRHYDARLASAEQMLRMATIDGAKLLGVSDQIGSLELGKRADIIALDVWQPHMLPLASAEGQDPLLWNLVFAARASDVKHVWVDGHQCLAHGGLTGVNEDDALQAVHQQTLSLLSRRSQAKAKAMVE